MEKPEIKNTFTSRSSTRKLTFREREGKPSVELYNPETNGVNYFPAKPEDDLAMAIAVLGVERVTDEVEEHAEYAADTGLGVTSEALLKSAVIDLRAAMILREREGIKQKKELEDAYALYKLAYPESGIGLAEFYGCSLYKFWRANLRKVRKDPTALGSL